MKLDVAFWLLNADGTYRCPLPDHGKWTLSPIAGAPGAITLDYPVTGQNFAALREHHDADRDAQVAIWIDGQDDGSLRALLVAEDADDIDDAAVWTFTGHFTEVRTEEAVIKPRTEVVVPPGGEVPTEDLAAFRVYSATAGTIMRTLMQEAHADGELADIGFDSFTGTYDSNGVAWSKVITLKFAPGNNFLKVLEALDEYQMCEWAVVDGELELYEPGSRGVDRTLGTNPVILRRGRDMTDSPRKRTIRGAPTDLVVAGAEGLYVRVTDETARARRGRVITAYASAGSLNDEGSLLDYGQTKLAQLVHGTMEVTHGLSLGDEGPVPLLDYHVSDWLWSDTGRPELERLQVAQITVSGDESGEITGSVSLNDLIASRQAELARRISGIEGGSTITGTSQARPVQEGPDTTIPAAPQGVVAQTSAYVLATGEPNARVTVEWAPVTTNTDQTAIEDLEGYRVRYRYADSAPDAWTTVPDVTTTLTTFAGLAVGERIGVQVASLDRAGHFSAWSSEAQIVTADDTTAPPAPSAAVVTPYLGVLLVEIDGLGAQGEPMPADTQAFQIHRSTTDAFTPTPDTLFDRLVGARTTVYTEGAYGVRQYFRVVAEDRSGNLSEPSASSSAVPTQANDGDLAGLNVGKLTTGELKAIVLFVTGMLRSAATGRRWELDGDGLRFYDSAGNVTINLDEPTASAILTGTVQTGRSGRRAVLSGQGSDLRFYPQVGESRYASMGSYIPNNYPNDIALDIKAIDSDQTDAAARIYVLPDQIGIQTHPQNVTTESYTLLLLSRNNVGMGIKNPTNGSRDGGFVELGRGSNGQAEIGRQIGGGPVSSFRVTPNGNAAVLVNGKQVLEIFGEADDYAIRAGRLEAYGGGAGKLRMDASSGQCSFRSDGGADPVMDADFFAPRYVKNFVVEHPGDPDRWLVHACTETPEAAVEYSGITVVSNWEAEVTLPDYFEKLTQVEGRQVWLQVLLPETGLHRYLPRAAASLPHDGRFRISTDADDGARIAWKVKAIRKDVGPLDPEPARSRVDVHGDGPYTYLVPREA